VVKICRRDDLAPIKQWTAHPKPLDVRAAVSADGNRLATYGSDKVVRVWKLPEGEKLAEFAIEQAFVEDLALSRDGRLLAVGKNKRNGDPCAIHLLDVDGQRLIRDLHGHKSAVLSLSFSADRKSLASASLDRTVRVWDVPQQ
jgi:WD40 repeat protein